MAKEENQKTTKNPDDTLDVDEAGITKQKIDAKSQVRNISSGSKIFVGTDSYNSTGNKSITGVGFKPKFVEITANTPQSGIIAQSQGVYDGNNHQVLFFYGEDNTPLMSTGRTSSHIIGLEDQEDGTDSYASISSLDSDGFTLNISSAGFTVYFNYKCFG